LFDLNAKRAAAEAKSIGRVPTAAKPKVAKPVKKPRGGKNQIAMLIDEE
jgi:hypothetical protein